MLIKCSNHLEANQLRQTTLILAQPKSMTLTGFSLSTATLLLIATAARAATTARPDAANATSAAAVYSSLPESECDADNRCQYGGVCKQGSCACEFECSTALWGSQLYCGSKKVSAEVFGLRRKINSKKRDASTVVCAEQSVSS